MVEDRYINKSLRTRINVTALNNAKRNQWNAFSCKLSPITIALSPSTYQCKSSIFAYLKLSSYSYLLTLFSCMLALAISHVSFEKLAGILANLVKSKFKLSMPMWSLFMYCELSSFILDDNIEWKVGAITNEAWNALLPLQKQYQVPCTWIIQAVLIYFRLWHRVTN